MLDATQVRLILNANVVVNFNSSTSTVEPIIAIATRPRDPIFVPRGQFTVISFEAATFEASKLKAPVVQRLTGLGEVNAPNSSLTFETNGLGLHVHNSRTRKAKCSRQLIRRPPGLEDGRGLCSW